jgi:hypothetical protein
MWGTKTTPLQINVLQDVFIYILQWNIELIFLHTRRAKLIVAAFTTHLVFFKIPFYFRLPKPFIYAFL